MNDGFDTFEQIMQQFQFDTGVGLEWLAKVGLIANQMTWINVACPRGVAQRASLVTKAAAAEQKIVNLGCFIA